MKWPASGKTSSWYFPIWCGKNQGVGGADQSVVDFARG